MLDDIPRITEMNFTQFVFSCRHSILLSTDDRPPARTHIQSLQAIKFFFTVYVHVHVFGLKVYFRIYFVIRIIFFFFRRCCCCCCYFFIQINKCDYSILKVGEKGRDNEEKEFGKTFGRCCVCERACVFMFAQMPDNVNNIYNFF